MKLQSICKCLALAACSMMAIPSASAVNYYWDSNNNTAGFGTASGTWAAPTIGTTTSGWSTNSGGTSVVSGNSVTTTTADLLFFGMGTGTNQGLGTGTITVSGTVSARAFSGMNPAAAPSTFTFSGGTINFAAAAGIDTVANTTFIIDSQITGASTSLAKTGVNGTLRLNNANNSYTGFTSIIGTLELTSLGDGGSNSTLGASSNAATNLQIAGSAGINQNGILSYIGTTNVSTDRLFTILGTSLGANSGTIANNSASGSVNFTNSGALAYGTVDQARTFNLGGTHVGDNIMSAQIVDNGTGAVSFTKTGAGRWILANNSNSFTGNAHIQEGTVAVNSINDAGNNSALGTGQLILGNASTTGTLEYLGGTQSTNRTIQISNDILGSGGATILNNGTGTLTFTATNFNSSYINSDIVTRTLTLGGSNNGVIEGVIQDISAATKVSLYKTGSGTWTLASANTFSGDTSINAGILNLTNANALQNSVIDTTNSITGNATNGFRTNQTTLTFGGLTGNTNLSTVFSTSSGGYSSLTDITLNLGLGVSRTYAAVIGGNLNLTKSGSGTQTFSGANNYTGNTTVSEGTLILTAANSYSGTTTISGGTLQLGSNGTTGSLTGTSSIINNGALTINRSNAFTQATDLNGAVISGTGSFNHVGNGTTTLSAANTYTGVTSITNNGTLQIASIANGGVASALGASSNSAANLVIGGTNNNQSGTLSYIGTANASTDRLFTAIGRFDGVNTSTIANNSASGTLNFTNTGAVAYGDLYLSRSLVLGGTNTLLNTFNPLIANNQDIPTLSDGIVSLEKTGAGTWFLANESNSYLGRTRISAGTLIVTKMANYYEDSSIGWGTEGVSIALGSSSTLLYAGTGDDTDRTIDFTPGGGTSILNNGTGALNFTAATFNTDSIFQNTNGRTLTLGGTHGGTISGTIRDTGNDVGGSNGIIGVIKNGSGTWTIAGSNDYVGSTTINAGTLRLDYSINNDSKLGDVTTVGILSLNGGTLELSGGSHAETVLSTTLGSGTNFINRTSGSSTLLMGAITYTGGALNFSAAGIANVSTSAVTNGILSSAGGTARVTVGGTDWATKDGSNNVIAYTGYTSFTGAATVANTNYSSVGNVTLSGNSGATTNTFKITTSGNGQSMDLGANTLTLGSMLFAGANHYSITNTSGGSINSGFLLHNYGAGTLTLGSTNGTITQYGTGTTILSGNNAANVGINILGGTVQFSDNLQIGTNATVQTIALSNGTLRANTATSIALNNGGLNSRTVLLGAGGGTLDIIGGGTMTVSGVISGSAGQFPTLTIGSASSNGTIALTGTNTYTGATILAGGTLSVGTIGDGGVAGNLGQGISAPYNLIFDGGTLAHTGASEVSNRAFRINTGKTATISTTNNLSLEGATGPASNGALTKTGAGTLTLTGRNTYTGATTVSTGRLTIASTGSVNSSSGVTVAAGASFFYNSSTALDADTTITLNGVNATTRAVLGGSGTINQAIILNNVGDTLAPGNSPGLQAFGVSQMWASFSYDWEINDWTAAVAGTNIDQIQITGSLDLSAVSANQYVLNILSLNSLNVTGLVGAGTGNTFSEVNRTWNIITTTGGITGFNANEWMLNTTGFQNTETGTWSIAQSGNNLVLNYTVIPEPTTALLGSLGLLLLFRRRR